MGRSKLPREVRVALHSIRRLGEVLRESGQEDLAASLLAELARAGNWMATRSTLTAFAAYCHPQSLGGSPPPSVGARAWQQRIDRLARHCRDAVAALDRMSPEERADLRVPPAAP